MEYMAFEIALQARDYDQDHIQHVNRRRMQATGMDLDDIWSQHTNLDKPDRYITSQVLHLLMDNRQVVGLHQRFSLQGITRVVENSQSRALEDIALVLTTCVDAHQALEESPEIPMTDQECAEYKNEP